MSSHEDLIADIMQLWRPPEDLTMSEWADLHRYVSEPSPESGRWKTSRFEPAREIMDTISSGDYEKVVMMLPSQSGKTEIILNTIGYIIDQDPGGILLVFPTLNLGEDFSKGRLTGMLRDTKKLSGLVLDPYARDSSNTVKRKEYPGGSLELVGANSPTDLASRPKRYLIFDELSRAARSAGKEGDPLALAEVRTKNYWNRLILLASSPLEKGLCRTEKEHNLSDKRNFFLMCPECSNEQVLRWGGRGEQYGLKWTRDGEVIRDIAYMCEFCGCLILEHVKNKMVRNGQWKKTAESDVAGFHLNQLYSPWSTWLDIVKSYYKSLGDSELMKVWVNTTLALPSDPERGAGLEFHRLVRLQEEYPFAVPKGVVIITVGVDIHDDRAEVEFVGWGVGEESWSIDCIIHPGDPDTQIFWDGMTDILNQRYESEEYGDMGATIVFIDSGHKQDAVYRYCSGKQGVYPIKGRRSLPSSPVELVEMKMRKGKKGRYVSIGTSIAKDLIYSRLRLEEPGPGYCHFPAHYDLEYFKELVAEVKKTTKVNGLFIQVWDLPAGVENHKLDCRVYAFAALRYLHIDLAKQKKKIDARGVHISKDVDKNVRKAARIRSSGIF